MVELRKKGIFYSIEGKDALCLASRLGIKLLEKKVTYSNGRTDVRTSCGFPKSGLDKYIGKLVRFGRDVVIIENGEIVEKIELVKGEMKK